MTCGSHDEAGRRRSDFRQLRNRRFTSPWLGYGDGVLILIVALSWLGCLALIIALRVRATKPWRASAPATQSEVPRALVASARVQMSRRRAAPARALSRR